MSLIQDALKKVQDERNKIQNHEEHKDKGTESTENKAIKSNIKRYIIIGSSLLLLIIISISATFLLKKPVKINKNNFLKTEKILKNKQNIKKQPTLIKKAQIIQEFKNKSLKTIPEHPKKKLIIKKEPEVKKMIDDAKAFKPQKKTVFPPFKQKVQLISKKVKKQKAKKITQFETASIQGKELYKQKKYNEAASYFKNALKIKKSRALYLNIYKCYKKSNNIVLLKAYTVEALTHFKNDAFFNKVGGILLFRERNYKDALKYFNLIQNKNGDTEVLTYKGLCLFHLNNYEESLLIFKKILNININKVESYYYIGLIYDNLKNYNEALYNYKVFEQLFDKQKTKNNFRHHNWVRQRISILENRTNQ